MNYQETLNYLYAKLPMFTRVGASAYKKDLTNTIKFCEHLQQPQHQFKSIHVGGTNGKGSTSHMLAAILQKAGYKTGLYTSPHLKDFRERIRINGEMIKEEDVVNFVASNHLFIEQLSPSFFEATVAMAFDHFAKNKVDIAVIEVGLGGRLDSTNVIFPQLSVITNISYDHMNLLGNTLPEIAFEKAGIIKQNTPVIIGELQPEVASVFTSKAQQTNSPIIFASKEWKIIAHELTDHLRKITVAGDHQTFELTLDLTGSYQLKNILTVLSAVNALNNQGYEISDSAIVTALSQVKKLTGLLGRWQKLSNTPLVICDTGHNEDGIKEVIKNISTTPYEKLLMVIGMVKDKDIKKVLTLLPSNAIYFFCQPDVERAKPADELKQEALTFGLTGNSYPSVRGALEAAKSVAKNKDLIFVGGSTFVVAEII